MDLYSRLEQCPTFEDLKPHLRGAFEDALTRVADGSIRPEDAAYELAGLMALPVLRGVRSTDPYMEVLFLAGVLELPPEHRGEGDTWEEFERLVRGLERAQ